MEHIIDRYQDIVVQIATPYATGTGFYLNEADLIITNEHVVRDNRQVVIESPGFERQLCDVVYMDVKYDLAFLQAPKQHSMGKVKIGEVPDLALGDPVIAMGHPFGLKFTATQGIISSLDYQMDGVMYIQHDAALNPGNSGGPLLTAKGHLIGVNSFVIRDGQSIGFALPVNYLKDTLAEFLSLPAIRAVRCPACTNMVFERPEHKDYCPYCGTELTCIGAIPTFEPLGIPKTIEDILFELGYNVQLSRVGPNLWQILKGSALIDISYHERTGLIVGDATLCELPKNGIEKIYRFMLQQNYTLEGLSFSVREHDVVLSLLIYDQYLNKDSGKRLIEDLFEKADFYDNKLVEEMGAHWKTGKNPTEKK